MHIRRPSLEREKPRMQYGVLKQQFGGCQQVKRMNVRDAHASAFKLVMPFEQ
jgi:hypothetical protein